MVKMAKSVYYYQVKAVAKADRHLDVYSSGKLPGYPSRDRHIKLPNLQLASLAPCQIHRCYG
jgi:hypothetical protein